MDLLPDYYIRSIYLERTISVISSDPLYKDGNARFTLVPFKALSDQF